MAPLKVCFVSPAAYPYFHPSDGAVSGGAELQVYTFATELARDSGFSVSLAVAGTGQEGDEVREGVRLLSLGGSGTEGPKGVARVLALWKTLAKAGADVYVQRAWGSLTGETALFCLLRRKKFIYMVAHDEDLLLRGYPSWLPSGTKARAQWRAFRTGLRLADLVVVQHEGQVRDLAGSGRKKWRVRPCAHRDDGKPPAEKTGEKVLWAARCLEWKRPELFLELARRLPGQRFLMACPPSGEEGPFGPVQAAASAAENVEFLGGVPGIGMRDVYGQAALFVNTSASEGFPNTFVEAMKAGVPVLSLSVDPGDVLRRSGAGRCFSGDFEALCTEAEKLLADPGRRDRMGRRGYRWFRDHHDISQVIVGDKKMLLEVAGRTAV